MLLLRASAISFATLTLFATLALAQKPPTGAKSPAIQSAKTVAFVNQTGSDATGNETLAELKKWGRFRITSDKKSADLILLLSADPYRGGQIIFADGQTGSATSAEGVQQDKVPDFNRQSPTRDAYLTVLDPRTGEKLWTDSHAWGGLLTGKNSAGARLVRKLQKEVDH